MPKYYGVERSEAYLAHYGVKGMKWGVRKAIERGNQRALHKQYTKAQNKLVKLNKNANIGEQRMLQQKYAKRAGIGLGIGMLGAGGVVGATKYVRRLTKNYDSAHNALYKGLDDRVRARINNPNIAWAVDAKNKELSDAYRKAGDALVEKGRIASKIGTAAAVADLAGIAYGGYAGTRSHIARYRTTPKGHAKAVAKRDAYAKEMKKAFKDTPYSNPSYWAKQDYKLNKKRYDKARAKAAKNQRRLGDRYYYQKHD